jgi:uncharacterized protein involved in tolerance to divalent cations
MLIVLTTVADQAAGDTLGVKIVEAKLAACVQVLPRMLSIYVWDGRINRDDEHLILIKTLTEKWEALVAFITANHPYDTPEIVAVDAASVSGQYSDWIKAVLA